MFSKQCLALVLCAVVTCESAFVDTLVKCGKEDFECQRHQMQTVLQTLASGAPELNLPPIDPVDVKDFKLSILNVLNMTLNGVAKGAKKCVVNNFESSLDVCFAKLDITCNMTFKGTYKVFSDSPTVKSFFNGESVHGDGNGKVKIDQLNLQIEIPCEIVKRDGEIYLIGKNKNLKYSYDIQNMVFAADNLYIGKTESSAMIVNLMNQNWKLMIGTFGKDIVKTAFGIVYKIADKFYSYVPAKYYILDDLSSYVKN